MDFIKQILDFFEKTGFNLITVAVISIFGSQIIKCILRILKRTLLESSMDRLLVRFVLAILRTGSYVFLLLYCFSVLDIPLDGMVSAISAITLAIGLSIQDIISGVASGLMLVSIHPFSVGDYIEVDGKGGSVKEVNLFHTVLVSPDKKKILVPNKTIFSSDLVNYSTSPTRRLDIDFGVDYDNDLDAVRSMLLSVAAANPMVLKTPEPAVMLSEIRDSDLVFKLRLYVANNDYWSAKFALNEALIRASRENGIDLCYPQITISHRKGDN